jgi:hypothetical protein
VEINQEVAARNVGITDGSGECTPRNRRGPYFRKDCVAREYGRTYDLIYMVIITTRNII